MQDRAFAIGKLLIVGGKLCLDFANTMDWRGTERARDWLATYADLVAWGLQAGALDSGAVADRLLERAASESAASGAVLDRARGLRKAFYGVAATSVRGHSAPPEALGALNRYAFPLLACTRLVPADGGFVRIWAGAEDAPERVLWPVAWSAIELLSGDELARVRECANADCRWLFIDRSRNRSRRWCDMRNCGNVMKARRHRQRRHKAVPGAFASGFDDAMTPSDSGPYKPQD